MAKRTTSSNGTDLTVGTDHELRTLITRRLAQLTAEQTRLREMLGLLAPEEEPAKLDRPLVPEPAHEIIPSPRRRTWSPEAREAQRKRMKAHWRKQKAASKR
jgi:hypothetical protein